jgi:hypothetical protein
MTRGRFRRRRSSSDAATAHELMQSLVGRSLPQTCVGVADLQMNFDDGETVQLEGTVVVDNSAPLDPWTLDALALLLPLLNTTVTTVVVQPDSGLLLKLGSTTVPCPMDSSFEPWSYSGPEATVTALPDGDIAIFNDLRGG